MKSKIYTKRVLVTILLVCCCYQEANAVRKIKGSKAKNITMADKTTNQTNEKIRDATEVDKTTTTTATTLTTTITAKPKLAMTTLLADFEMNGRHAAINNQFVAEDEKLLNSYNPLQRSSYDSAMAYEQEEPNIKDALNKHQEEVQKVRSKPLLVYDIDRSADYEDEETNDYNSENEEDVAENCEDTQESLTDNNDKDIHEESTFQNKLQADLGGSYDGNNFVQQTNAKTGLLYVSQSAAKTQAQHSYGQAEINKNYQQNLPHDQYMPSKLFEDSQENSLVKLKPPYSQRAHYAIAKTPQPLSYLNPPISKPPRISDDKLNFVNNMTEPLNLHWFNSSFVPSVLYNKPKAQTSSPFSSKSAHNKKFKTVSSSIQYVSTPFNDLVFKYSIGMAKHSKAANNSSDQAESRFMLTNNINGKTE